MNASGHNICMSHITTYEWVMSQHAQTRNMTSSCRAYCARVYSLLACTQVRMGHVTRMNGSCHTFCMSHMCMSHVAHVIESCHTCTEVCDVFIFVPWLMYIIHTCGTTYSHVCHDSSACVIWLIHMCGMTHSYVWRDWCICVASLIHLCEWLYRWHASWHAGAVAQIWMSSDTDVNESWPGVSVTLNRTSLVCDSSISM